MLPRPSCAWTWTSCSGRAHGGCWRWRWRPRSTPTSPATPGGSTSAGTGGCAATATPRPARSPPASAGSRWRVLGWTTAGWTRPRASGPSSTARSCPGGAGARRRSPRCCRCCTCTGCPAPTQQARNLLLVLGEQGRRARFVLHDRDAKFSRSFDDVFRPDGAKVLVTPVQAPRANAYAERWVRTVRAECLDWLLVVGRGHLQHVLRVYVQHYNRHRPHRALLLQPPDPPAQLTVLDGDRGGAVNRIDLLGGLHEYRPAA